MWREEQAFCDEHYFSVPQPPPLLSNVYLCNGCLSDWGCIGWVVRFCQPMVQSPSWSWLPIAGVLQVNLFLRSICFQPRSMCSNLGHHTVHWSRGLIECCIIQCSYMYMLHVCVSQNLLRWFSNKIPMSDDKGRVQKIVYITFQFDHNYRPGVFVWYLCFLPHYN